MSRDESRKSRLAGPLSKKVKFTKTEDLKLKDLIEKYSTNDWKKIAKHLPPRTARQCRERWCNYIDPNLSQEPWTPEEDEVLLKIHEQIGNHWKKMEEFLPKRSKNNIKKRWRLLTNSYDDEGISQPPKQTVPELPPLKTEKVVVSTPPNLYLSSPSFSQISKQTMIPIISTGPAAIVPLVPVYVSFNTPIINVSNDFPSYTETAPHIYQEIIAQPSNPYIQPLYKSNIYQVVNENYL